jgi:hypothetical protein
MDTYDSTRPQLIPSDVESVLVYIDGPDSEWPQDQVERFATKPMVTMSVFANPSAMAFDIEGNNAPLGAVIDAAKARLARRQWSLLYTDKDQMHTVAGAAVAAGLLVLPGSAWPQPGAYLFITDPTGERHLTVTDAPVEPLMVQWAYDGDYDISTGAGDFPAALAPTSTGSDDPNTPTTPGEVSTMPSLIKALTAPGKGYYLFWTDGTVNAMAGAPFYGAWGDLTDTEREATPAITDALLTGGGGYVLINTGVQPGGGGCYQFGPD